jgi:hypothetical protein
MARPKKPTEVKVLQGTHRQDRDKKLPKEKNQKLVEMENFLYEEFGRVKKYIENVDIKKEGDFYKQLIGVLTLIVKSYQSLSKETADPLPALDALSPVEKLLQKKKS